MTLSVMALAYSGQFTVNYICQTFWLLFSNLLQEHTEQKMLHNPI